MTKPNKDPNKRQPPKPRCGHLGDISKHAQTERYDAARVNSVGISAGIKPKPRKCTCSQDRCMERRGD